MVFFGIFANGRRAAARGEVAAYKDGLGDFVRECPQMTLVGAAAIYVYVCMYIHVNDGVSVSVCVYPTD